MGEQKACDVSQALLHRVVEWSPVELVPRVHVGATVKHDGGAAHVSRFHRVVQRAPPRLT